VTFHLLGKLKNSTSASRALADGWAEAAPGSGFAYIAVTPTQKGKTNWLEAVSDKDYNAVK
jgi:hypothetical protein